LSALVRQ